MDYLAHILWSYILFHKTKEPKYAMMYGVVPDTLSWVIFFFYQIVFVQTFGRPNLTTIPEWTFTLYNISHSLVIALVVIGVVYLILKKVPIYMWAWPIHIIVDVPTHSREFLPTPFLWPLSTWKFPGFSWGTWWFMLLNYTVIISCLVWIALKKRKAKKSK